MRTVKLRSCGATYVPGGLLAVARMHSGLKISHSLDIQSDEPVTNQAKCVAAATARKNERQKNLGRKTSRINLTMMAAPASIGRMETFRIKPESRDRYLLDLREPWVLKGVPLSILSLTIPALQQWHRHCQWECSRN